MSERVQNQTLLVLRCSWLSTSRSVGFNSMPFKIPTSPLERTSLSKLWLSSQIQPPALFCKWNFVGAQPRPSVYGVGGGSGYFCSTMTEPSRCDGDHSVRRVWIFTVWPFLGSSDWPLRGKSQTLMSARVLHKNKTKQGDFTCTRCSLRINL